MANVMNANKIRTNATFKAMELIVLFIFSILNLILFFIKH